MIAADSGHRVLIDAFNDDQTERYNMYRRVKLKKETVRRVGLSCDWYPIVG